MQLWEDGISRDWCTGLAGYHFRGQTAWVGEPTGLRRASPWSQPMLLREVITSSMGTRTHSLILTQPMLLAALLLLPGFQDSGTYSAAMGISRSMAALQRRSPLLRVRL